MKSRSLLIPAIVAAAATVGASGFALAEPLDAQSHAAALLSGSHLLGTFEGSDQRDAPPASSSADARASAAALLSGRRTGGQAKASGRIDPPAAVRTEDAQAQAAALLSGSRATASQSTQITATREPSGQHPALRVWKHWSMRSMDPNHFIVAHPASPRWLPDPTE